ncbi:ABC transporter permease [Halomonas sp. TBZ9]|uniref:ABC transporter permease n=1 Tax=Vreelandella azerica TaxID=2732867 RepID=A0A7Y3XAE5_9GAMM|nr:ABC transporter permease [Halomonas azerica]NOG31110.1 ABC transporter permease [Halomonas azerica]
MDDLSNTSGSSPGSVPSSAPLARIETNQQLTLSGTWTLAYFHAIKKQLSTHDAKHIERLSLEPVTQLDTAAAQLMIEWFGSERMQQQANHLPDQRRQLILSVIEALEVVAEAPETPARTGFQRLGDSLARLGQQVTALFTQQLYLLGFLGVVLAAFGRTFWRPGRWRLTATVAHIHQTGLNAVPIVVLLTFMVGAVVAFLGATVLTTFGATIYTVNLVVFSFLREFGVLLAAIMLAGRTASAFTAQLGAMKSNEEIDALRTQGLDPIELLVLPRVIALWVSLPLLAFIGTLSGMLGGAVVGAVSLDIPFAQFWQIVQRDISVRHLWVGLSKAPLFALVIAIIGCAEGFKVSGSAQSVGERTTSSVVQSIFMVILLDALAALYFMQMGW